MNCTPYLKDHAAYTRNLLNIVNIIMIEKKSTKYGTENLAFLTKIWCKHFHFSLQIILIFQGSGKATADLTHHSEIFRLEVYDKYSIVLFDIYMKFFHNVLAQLFRTIRIPYFSVI